MSKVAVVTDSNSGISQELADKMGISVLPMPFTIDGKEYFEGISLTQEEFYEYLKKNCYGEIELCGLVSNICVLSNAVLAKTALPEANISVDAMCTASGDDRLNEEVLDVLASIHVEIKNREKI